MLSGHLHAQTTPTTATNTAAPAQDTAKDALAKKEGDVDQAALLKETLTAADKQYSLLRKSKLALSYDLSYAYIGSQFINAKFTDSTLTLFQIQNTRSHTVTNTVSADFGLRDNLTANATIPIISKYSQSEAFAGLSHTVGDISLGARWQPFELGRDLPTITASGSMRLPTGRSPYKVVSGQSLATGSGGAALTTGLNASKVLDPVAVFGSASLTLSAPIKHLSQQLNGQVLSDVRPGPSFAFGAGFAYALSYKVSTTLSFQESLSMRSKLTLQDGTVSRTAQQTSGILNFGLGVRMAPQTTVNFSLGVGLTTDSPSFTLGLNLPLNL